MINILKRLNDITVVDINKIAIIVDIHGNREMME